MEQADAHDHITHAHLTGLIIGTVSGSCAVTLLAAIAIITASPRLILHPFNATSQISLESGSGQPAQLGIGARQLDSIFPKAQGSAGASRALAHAFDREP